MSRRESWVSHTAFPARVPAGGWSSSRNLKALFIFIAAAAGAPPPLGCASRMDRQRCSSR